MTFDASPWMLVAAVAALLAGGVAKGILGVGLPMIALPLLYTSIPIREAVALMYGPVLVMNVWQTFQGGYFATALRKYWPMMAAVAAGTVLVVGLASLTKWSQFSAGGSAQKSRGVRSGW